MSKIEPAESEEVKSEAKIRNQNDKRYEQPFEDECAPDDDFIDED